MYRHQTFNLSSSLDVGNLKPNLLQLRLILQKKSIDPKIYGSSNPEIAGASILLLDLLQLLMNPNQSPSGSTNT